MELYYEGESLSYTRTGDAGLDLCSKHEITLMPGCAYVCETQIEAISLPPNTVGLVCSRSGWATRRVTVVNQPGIIDENYRGPVKVLLENNSDKHYTIKVGDRIAQLLVIPVLHPIVVKVDKIDSDTVRGINGFGSSGR